MIIYIYCGGYRRSLLLAGNSGSPYRPGHGAAQQPHWRAVPANYPFLSLRAVFSGCPDDIAGLPVPGFLTCAAQTGCWCMRSLHMGAVGTLQESTVVVDSGRMTEITALPHRGLEPLSVLRLAFSQTLYNWAALGPAPPKRLQVALVYDILPAGKRCWNVPCPFSLSSTGHTNKYN